MMEAAIKINFNAFKNRKKNALHFFESEYRFEKKYLSVAVVAYTIYSICNASQAATLTDNIKTSLQQGLAHIKAS